MVIYGRSRVLGLSVLRISLGNLVRFSFGFLFFFVYGYEVFFFVYFLN